MAASVDTPSPTHLNHKATSLFMASSSSSPLFSPSSDKRFWSSLRSRIDTLLDDPSSKIPTAQNPPNADPSLPVQMNVGGLKRAIATKEDSLLLMRGFDSIAHTLSQLSNTLETALQGANDLAKPPTLTEIFHGHLNKSESKEKEEDSEDQKNAEDPHVGLKRKFDNSHCSEDQGDDSKKENEQDPKDGKLKKAKNLAISMATKATSFARELKSIRSDLCFMQERCALLEEENRRLRDGLEKGLRPEEDDLVRLQLEALLAEKSRLANENANLVRENQCLNQLVEYHQLTSHDLSASYEQVIQGLCLDFSSPPRPIAEEANEEDGEDDGDNEVSQTPQTNLFGFSAPLDDDVCSREDQ
ncbi:hypothetical protein PRUPE_8G241100 [Prunus persica]|uniref:Uncharacterized protein n=1 Tax=Prunus persica TaxID=3760 RepID=M5VLN1_PRUPE|nr:uncharacterized protein LOC18768216 [Prunus persica]ONH93594.1 hypothetical protein PRUPE_8G241100 [Prunus persica]